jgi:2-alkenal reductase
MSRDLEESFINVYQRINPSVVHIFVYTNQFDVPIGSGSGFVLDNEGHIVTNNHVVATGDEFEVSFADGSRRSADLIGTDVDSDLAVIQVRSLPSNVQPVPLADSAELQVGQFVIAIGNPFGEEGSMSFGIISALGRTIDSQRTIDGGGRYSLPQVIQTDAAINPGNSGGPLLNLDGEVIGVNSSILTRSGTNSGVGFSIPVNAVKRIAPSLISNGSYTYPYLGISMAGSLDLETQQELDLPDTNGVYVTNVVPDTPADRAGLIGEIGPGGDFIRAIDGQRIKDSSELISYLVFETEVGQTIELSVLRDNEEIVVPLILGARP